jgi:hypothetical protein
MPSDTRPDYTFRDPTLSLWQSASAATAWTQSKGEEALAVQANFMTPVYAVAAAAQGTAEAPTAEPESDALVADCSKLASQFLLARSESQRRWGLASKRSIGSPERVPKFGKGFFEPQKPSLLIQVAAVNLAPVKQALGHRPVP